MSNNIFENECIYFYGFKDKELKKFLQTNNGTVFSECNPHEGIITLIIYSGDSVFKKNILYNEATEEKIECMRKSQFLKQYDIIYDNEYKFVGDNSEEENNDEKMCKLIKTNLPDFYDDIFIPYGYFKSGNWNINDILRENTDALFYNKEYLLSGERKDFYNLFDKYIEFIKLFWEPNSQLNIYLVTWEQKENPTYLKQIMTDSKYKIISPLYMTDLYKKIFTKYKNDTDVFDKKFKKALDKIMIDYQKERNIFKRTFHELVDAYVCEYPIDNQYDDHYIKGFINGILLAIYDFADKLIDLNIYAIHSIIVDIIDYYVPLDTINTSKKIIII